MRRSLLVRAYLAWLRFLHTTVGFVQACSTGFWLGLMEPSDLAQVDAEYYNLQSMYQDENYNRSGLLWWEDEALRDYFADARRILVTAAGGGREVLALCRMGFEVEAFECNPVLASFANQLLAEEGYPCTVRSAERGACPEYHGVFDGVIIGWGSFMLIQGSDQRVRLLRHLRAMLRPGAPILVSFFAHEGESRRLATIARVGTWIRRLQGREPVEFGDDLAPNYVHHCSRAEITDSLERAGYVLAHYNTRDYGHAVALARQAASVHAA